MRSGPARSAVQYVRQTLDTNLYIKSVFFAPPGPDIDAAWDDLLKGALISKNRRKKIRFSGSYTSNQTNTWLYRPRSFFLGIQ